MRKLRKVEKCVIELYEVHIGAIQDMAQHTLAHEAQDGDYVKRKNKIMKGSKENEIKWIGKIQRFGIKNPRVYYLCLIVIWNRDILGSN